MRLVLILSVLLQVQVLASAWNVQPFGPALTAKNVSSLTRTATTSTPSSSTRARQRQIASTRLHESVSSDQTFIASDNSNADSSDSSESTTSKRNIDVIRSIELPFSREIAYDAFSDLSRQPAWSTWLSSVEILPEDPTKSKWTMKFVGFSYSWISVSARSERPSLMTWESISGLKNYGTVAFHETDRPDHCKMDMKMTFVAPRAVSMLFRRSKRIASFVEDKMIRTTMENFRDIVISDNNKEEGKQ